MSAILFSDLHYSNHTKGTCFELLRFIHDLALKEGHSVYFLGDFWNHVYNRGTLPVDLLNEMVRYFTNEWKVPMVMIPGNHDYYDSAEKEHGLESFHHISDYIQVISEPKVVNNILFLPYRRDVKSIEDVVSSTSCSAIMGHLDIIGAKMNHFKVSTVGIDSKFFQVPTYSGHYHTPSVKGNMIYIGSPYQVHLSEAEDNKSLTVLTY